MHYSLRLHLFSPSMLITVDLLIVVNHLLAPGRLEALEFLHISSIEGV